MIVVNARFLTHKITGVERFAIELSLQLKLLLKDEIIFVAPKNIILSTEAEKLNVQTIGKRTGHLWEQMDLPKYLRTIGKPMLVNLCSTAPVLYKNKLTVLHDITYIRYPKTFSFAFRTFYKIIIPLVLRTSKKICTVSEFSKNEISDYYKIPRDKISVVYNAVDSKFKPTKDESLAQEKYLLAVSSVKENKNFLFTLKVFEEIQKNDSDIQLFVVGDLNSKSFASIDLSNYLSNPRIRILGRVDDERLIKLYSNAICFLFPSLYEGFGIPVLEAQACGCPVIAASTSSLPEVLKESAFLIPVDEVNPWIPKIQFLRDDFNLRRDIILAGLKNSSLYSWNQSAQILISVISQNKRLNE